MSDYKHFLYAIELDDGSDEQINKVVNQANKAGNKVTLYHVVKGVVGSLDAGSLYIPGQTLIDIEKGLFQEAKDQAKQLADKIGIDQESIIIEVKHEPRQAIIEKAAELKVDMIILNGHRHNFLGRLGSTADAVINQAKCSVSIIRHNEYK